MNERPRDEIFGAFRERAMAGLRRTLDDGFVLLLLMFTGAMLVNGLLIILMIGVLQLLGLWMWSPAGDVTWLEDWPFTVGEDLAGSQAPSTAA